MLGGSYLSTSGRRDSILVRSTSTSDRTYMGELYTYVNVIFLSHTLEGKSVTIHIYLIIQIKSPHYSAQSILSYCSTAQSSYYQINVPEIIIVKILDMIRLRVRFISSLHIEEII